MKLFNASGAGFTDVVRWLSFAGVLCLAACSESPAPARTQQASELTFREGQLAASTVCKECHRDIFSYWSASAHATSATNRNFLVAHAEYRERKGGRGGPSICLSCHEPNRQVSDDEALARDGVSCDFCHSVTAVDPANRERPYTVAPGPVKRGPIRDAAEDRHETEYSELYRDSLLCAGCHEYRTPDGLAIISTFSEWTAAQSAGEKRTCQDCHMPVVRGSVVDAKVHRTEAPVNTHRMPGGHSRSQLRTALRLRIAELKQDGAFVHTAVEVENRGTGHSVPTGMPTRKLVLEVEAATPDGKHFREQRVFQKTLVDGKGLPVNSDSGAFLDAVRIGQDTRIKAGEKRIETFRFPIKHDEQATVRAALTYSYSPQPGNLPEQRIQVISAEESLAAR